VQRNVRYAWLNACRPWWFRGDWVQLVDDPLAWPWSTLHDSLGAVAAPWIPGERIGKALGWPLDADLPRRIHRYATADEHVAAGAREPLALAPPSTLPTASIREVLDAALIATRSPETALRQRSAARRVAAGLAYRQGWRYPAGLAPLLDVHPGSVPRLANAASPEELEAAAKCLSPRLRPPPLSRWTDVLRARKEARHAAG
jgi:hypothetical protein